MDNDYVLTIIILLGCMTLLLLYKKDKYMLLKYIPETLPTFGLGFRCDIV